MTTTENFSSIAFLDFFTELEDPCIEQDACKVKSLLKTLVF